MGIRLVLADDHPLILDGLEALLAAEADLEVVARCTTGSEAVAAVDRHAPDVLILDLRLPDIDGIEVMRALADRGSSTRVILLAASISDRELVEGIRLNVRGVVLKEMAPRLIIPCVRKVYRGEVWVEPQSIFRAASLMANTSPSTEVLTPRERDVARMAAHGLRNREIARRLSLTEGTVKVHLHNVYAKLGIEGRHQLAEVPLEPDHDG